MRGWLQRQRRRRRLDRRLRRAPDFAKDRGVGLVVTGTDSAEQLGSYPIYGYDKQRITVRREGPRPGHFKRQVPAHLRGW